MMWGSAQLIDAQALQNACTKSFGEEVRFFTKASWREDVLATTRAEDPGSSPKPASREQ
jgi:hypothetical protein